MVCFQNFNPVSADIIPQRQLYSGVLSDIYSAIDQDQVSFLALLDVNAAFDTVDHGILLERLSTSYGLSGMAYTWLESYITGQAQIIHVGNRHSPPSKVPYGVPQGSVLGPVLYVLYTLDVAKLVQALGLGAHLYADDNQLNGHCSPSNSFELASRVLRAIDSIHEWMSSNRLSLNTGKTQFIWLGTKHSLARRDTDRLSSLLPSLTELSSVRNLGFIIDQELNMKDHITKLCQSCYYQLRQIRTVRHSLTSSAIQTLVHAFVCTHVDFSNSLLYGTSAYLLDRLQSVLILLHDWSLKLANTIRSWLQSVETSTGCQFRIVSSSSSIPSQATAWLVVHQSTWLSSATPWTTFQQGATFGHLPRFSSWFLDIRKNARVAEVSPSPHHSCGIYFLPTSNFSTTSTNSSEGDLKLTTCNSPRYATEDLCHQCDLYYYYYFCISTEPKSARWASI